MIDADQYVYQLLAGAAAAVTPTPTVAADMDVDLIDELPFWSFTVTGDGQIANGPGLWTFQLLMNFFADGRDACFATASAAYQIVHGWDDDPAQTVLDIEGVQVWVSELTDIDVPSRTASVQIDGRDLVQFTGSFALALRSA